MLLAALAPAGRRGGCRRGRWRWAPRRRRRREPAPGGEARARRRRSTRSKSGSKCVALRRDLPSRAGLPIRPVRSGGAHHTPRCIIDPPRGTHHPPRPQRAPAGRAPGELPAGVGRPGELILRVAGGEGGGAAALGCPGQLSEGPGCPSGASSESGSTSLPRRFRRQRAACGRRVGEHGSRLGRVLERGGTAAGGWPHLQVPEAPPEVESSPSLAEDDQQFSLRALQSKLRTPAVKVKTVSV